MKRFSPWWGLLALGVALAALVAYLAARYPEVLAGRDGQVDLTRSLIWIGVIAASLFLHRRMPIGHALKYAAIWVALGAGLVLAYGFRHEAAALWDRFVAELLPHRPMTAGGVVEVRAGDHGHFVLEARVDGTDIRFLVDTGASDVVLSPADARRLGFDPDKLDFTRIYRTANGTVMGAPVRLGRVSVGAITVENVRASVNGAAMNRSLLGMSFLGRLGGYEVRDDKLILRP